MHSARAQMGFGRRKDGPPRQRRHIRRKESHFRLRSISATSSSNLAWSVDLIETEKMTLPCLYEPPIKPLPAGGVAPRLLSMASAWGPDAVSVRIMNCPPECAGP